METIGNLLGLGICIMILMVIVFVFHAIISYNPKKKERDG